MWYVSIDICAPVLAMSMIPLFITETTKELLLNNLLIILEK